MLDCEYNEKDSRPKGEPRPKGKTKSQGRGVTGHTGTLGQNRGVDKNSTDSDSALSKPASGERDGEQVSSTRSIRASFQWRRNTDIEMSTSEQKLAVTRRSILRIPR